MAVRRQVAPTAPPALPAPSPRAPARLTSTTAFARPASRESTATSARVRQEGAGRLDGLLETVATDTNACSVGVLLTACQIGFYKSTTGNGTCTPCGTNAYTASTGSTSASQCLCPASYYGDPTVSCICTIEARAACKCVDSQAWHSLRRPCGGSFHWLWQLALPAPTIRSARPRAWRAAFVWLATPETTTTTAPVRWAPWTNPGRGVPL